MHYSELENRQQQAAYSTHIISIKWKWRNFSNLLSEIALEIHCSNIFSYIFYFQKHENVEKTHFNFNYTAKKKKSIFSSKKLNSLVLFVLVKIKRLVWYTPFFLFFWKNLFHFRMQHTQIHIIKLPVALKLKAWKFQLFNKK